MSSTAKLRPTAIAYEISNGLTCKSGPETAEEETPEAAVKGLIKKTRQCFEGMKDPRKQCPALRHEYAGVLTMVAVALMFGSSGPTAVVRFWLDMAGHTPRRVDGLLRALGLKKLPSHDVIGRVMALTDPVALEPGGAGRARAYGTARDGTEAAPAHRHRRKGVSRQRLKGQWRGGGDGGQRG